ncbi:MAG: hypothetical protein WD960_11080 [Gemmatimonadota bacterium]
MNRYPERTHQLLVLCGLLLLLAGCGDRDRYRGIQVTSPETVPALDFNGDVTALPALVSSWGEGRVAGELVERWRSSWEMSHESGREVRAGIHREVAPALAERASQVEMGQALESLDRAVRGAESLLGGAYRGPGLLPALRIAEMEQERAGAALAGGNRILAVQHLLAGTDALQSVTPEAIARSLIVEGELSLRQARADGEERRRAERLLDGARAALEDEAPVLALRRSWYAVRLLEGRVAP